MKNFISIAMLCIAGICVPQNASAQGFLNKMKSAVSSVTKTDNKTTQTTATAPTENKIKADDFPSYTCKKVYEINANGDTLKNEDGTNKYRVFLYDKNGNKVSSEMVNEQISAINSAVASIATKAAVGGGLGALQGGTKGALIGVAAALGLSVDDIITIVKMKKETSRQKKALKAYRESFNEEGIPTSASVDAETLEQLGITDDDTISETTAKIEEDLNNETFKNIASNSSIDALLESASKD